MSNASLPVRIGLLFGSFNPVHIGHLIVAQHMATRTDLTEVWFVLSPQSPYKVGHELLPEQARLDLLQAAIAGNALLHVTDVELHLPKPNYTITTLDALQLQHPHYKFVLLIGGDNLVGLAGWRDADRIQREFDIYVYQRPGYPVPIDTNSDSRIRIVEAPLLDISATFIRQSIASGKSIRYLVPEVVEEQIIGRGYWQQ